MELIALALMGIGGLLAIVGGLWMLIEQFKTSILWGIGCLILPFVSLIWLIMHWEQGKKPFLILVAGLVLGMVSGFLIGSLGGGMEIAPVQ